MNKPVIIVTDPSSSGSDLIQALLERGARIIELWHPERFNLRPTTITSPTEILIANEELTNTFANRDISAILAGNEYGVPLAEQLAHTLGLPGNDMSLARSRRDKEWMLDTVARHGIDVGWTIKVTDNFKSTSIPDSSTGYIVKPIDSAGSDGVSLCTSPQQACSAASQLLRITNMFGTKNSSVIIQEYLIGPQYIINTVSNNGTHNLVDCYLYKIDIESSRPVIKHATLITELDNSLQCIVDYTFECLDALGIRNGAAHSEVRLTTMGPRLIEVNSRLMGPTLPADIYISCVGQSHATALADSVINDSVRPINHSRHFGQVLLRSQLQGALHSMPGMDLIRAIPGFSGLRKLPKIGHILVPSNQITSGTLGIAYFSCSTESELSDSLEQLHTIEREERIFRVSD